MANNLLTDPLLTVTDHRGLIHRLSLPELLERLGRGDVASYAGAQRHQVSALHIFLCHVAFHALELSGQTDCNQAAEFWRAALRELAGRDDDCAWCLVVDDPALPAFMQPPTERMAEFTANSATPDEMDVLQLAKNHDAKKSRMAGATPEAWALALISIQTMGGNLGRGSHPISRMNGGYGCRVLVAAYTDVSPAVRWREDTQRLLAGKERLLAPPYAYKDDGLRLLWTHPWDTDQGLSIDSLHPYYIEVCRRRRLVATPEGLMAMGRGTNAGRIAGAGELHGNVGDPWIPIHRKTGKSMTPPPTGLSAKLLRDLIVGTGDLAPSAMQALPRGDGPVWFHLSVLIRGQGKTEGYHEAHLRIPHKAKSLLLSAGPDTDALGALSQYGIDRASTARNRALRPALFSLLEGGPEGWPDTNGRDAARWAEHWTGRFDALWEQEYFSWLWSAVDRDGAVARDAWSEQLSSMAARVFKDASLAAPQRSGRRYRGRMRAENLLYNLIRKHLPKEIKS